jgi:TonB-dependent starch-binding outer membrane protein SusC
MQNDLCNRYTIAPILDNSNCRFLTRTYFRVMQLTAFLITICSFTISARTISQSITYSGENMPLKTIFNIIEKQTGYFVVFDEVMLDKAKPVSVSARNIPLDNFLQLVLTHQPFAYSVNKTTISIELKSSAESLRAQGISSFIAEPPVTGVVRGPDGQPVAGANVVVKGTKTGVVSGADGSFLINANKGDVLTISSIGYEQKQITVSFDKSSEIIVLNIATSKLDEIRVIAYGTTSKRLSTSTNTGINADDIKTQPINNPLLALVGRTTGIVIEQATGMPGSALKIRIQGQNSIGKGNDPFYVVDGVPYAANLLPTGSNVLGGSVFNGTDIGSGTGNPFSFINPSDVESIELLKDADATAIYGSRAANGAILITTKKGKYGKTNLDINFQQGVGKLARRMDLLNTSQYIEMRKEAYKNDGLDIPNPLLSIFEKNFTNYDLTVWDPVRYTDWQKELLGGSSNYTDIQASISGGSNQTAFRLSGGYHKETTVFPGDFADRKASIGINVNHISGNQKIKIQFSANYLDDNNQLPGTDITGTALRLSPNAPALYNSDGSLNWARIEVDPITHDSISTFDNPLKFTLQQVNFKNDNLIGNANLSYNIIKGLVAKANFGYSLLQSTELTTTPLISYPAEERPFQNRSATYGDSKIRNWIVEPQLDFNTSIGIGKMQVLGGATFQETNSDNIRQSGTGYPNDLVLADLRAASTLKVLGDHIISQYKYAALFGRLNYNIENKYIVNLTMRRDGSSRFGSDNRFHTFSAVGAAWIFSSENFISNTLSFLSFGKLRGSYGTTGNDQIGNYSFLNIYNTVSGSVPYNGFNGIAPISHYNPYLQWELTKKLQLGADLGFIQDRVLLSFNFYRNQSSNQLVTYILPFITGFGDVTKNFPATVRNSGCEISLNTINIKKKLFSWLSSLNFTVSKNQLIKFENLETSTYNEQLVAGEPINLIRLYEYAGIDPENGNVQFRNSEGKITQEVEFEKDRIVAGNINPRYYGGLLNSFSYKGVDISFLFQFTKQKTGNGKLPFLIGDNYNQPEYVLQRWQNPGDQTDVPRYSTNTYLYNATSSSYNYVDASYIRLKNVSLSWTIPAQWTKNAKIQNVRVFTQAQNLLTITNYAGLDPESLSNSTLPPLRVITFGIQMIL